MNLNIKKFLQIFSIPLAILCFQSAHAQPIMIPGFMGIESSYLDALEADSDSTMAYFTISNLHQEPILLLGASGDKIGHAMLNNSDHQAVDSILIEPGQRLVMQPDGYHVHLDEIDTSDADEGFYAVTLLVRRGLEAMEEVEAIENLGAMSGQRGREAGIPNEQEFVVNVPIRN
ncbi:MAG: copper chaperone PCu(A)C [Gammaproteobacteria bacterium]|jgi:copper(I)-binding protein|nr:copper chaperone PCu(A)C [Gammaproteobacteria bacterium]